MTDSNPAAPPVPPASRPIAYWLNPWHLKASLLYIALVPFINWAFLHTPSFELPGGGNWTPVAFVTGLVFVVRDFSQREVGNKRFLIAFVIAAILTFWLADPALAAASVTAFAISELVDWAVFTFTKRPLSDRILISSLVAVPIDSVILLAGLSVVAPQFANWPGFWALTLSKLAGAFVVWLLVRRREAKQRRGAIEAGQPANAPQP